MELKTILYKLRSNIITLVIVTIACTVIATGAVFLYTITHTSPISEQEHITDAVTTVNQTQLYVFEAFGYISFTVDYSILGVTIDEDSSAWVNFKYEEIVANIKSFLYSSTFFSAVAELYDQDMSNMHLRQITQISIPTNGTYIYYRAQGTTAGDAVRLANVFADVAINKLPEAINGISHVTMISEAYNDYGEAEINELKTLQNNAHRSVGDTDHPEAVNVDARTLLVQRLPVFVLLGFILGFCIAACVIFLKEYMSPYFTNAELAERVLGVKIIAEVDKLLVRKAAIQLSLYIKSYLPCVITFLSIDKKIDIDALMREIVLFNSNLRVLTVNTTDKFVDDGKEVIVQPDKMLQYIEENKAGDKYDIILVDGGSLSTNYQSWELLSIESIAVGVIDKNKTKIANAQRVVRLMESVGCALSLAMWINVS